MTKEQTNVFILLKYSKAVLIDKSTNKIWANEYFNTIEEATKFCQDNGLELDPLHQFKTEWAPIVMEGTSDQPVTRVTIDEEGNVHHGASGYIEEVFHKRSWNHGRNICVVLDIFGRRYFSADHLTPEERESKS